MTSLRLFGVKCAALILLGGCGTGRIALKPGEITTSGKFGREIHRVDMQALQDSVYLRVQGDNLVLDFNHAVIDGRVDRYAPNTFEGIALHIRDSRHVTIRNLTIHGFKIAILAENVEHLSIINCNLSYNYRPKLHSKWDRESLSDWLYFHQNENDEWKRYGAAIYLKNCDDALVRDVLCHNGMNGLLMVQCENALIYNNDIRFNSGLGIGLYRSSHHRIMHNRLDWNARGYSHGMYARGQDSAAILLYEQSSHNTIAFNSATHSGDGLFLWAGQYTMDTGLGGCDSNLIYRNDFSHSIANGVEATFSANWIIENKLNDCRYGVWGGYSHHSVISGNEIRDCDYGIAIEHGNHIDIRENVFSNCSAAIKLWERETQPPDWPYAQARDVSSRNYTIRNNEFDTYSLDITGTDVLFVHSNTSHGGDTIRVTGDGSEVIEKPGPDWVNEPVFLPGHMKDAIDTELAPGMPRGREYIIVNEWGPYDFLAPRLVLRSKDYRGIKERWFFDILGPRGTWTHAEHMVGVKSAESAMGTIPDVLEVEFPEDASLVSFDLKYSGDKVVTQFGDTIPRGTPYYFGFRESALRTPWEVQFFHYSADSDPVRHPDAFARILKERPDFKTQYDQIAGRWWGSPAESIASDSFAIVATTDFTTMDATYQIAVESDDGVRVWLDNKMILERWNVHTPVVDDIRVRLSEGSHSMRVEYFEASGLAVLDVSVGLSVSQ